MGYCLGLDLGTTNTKACALAEDGSVLFRASHPTEVIPVPTGAEIAPVRYWEELYDFIAGIIDSVFGISEEPLSCISIAGMAEAGCLIDAASCPQTPVLLWYDKRGAEEAEELRADHEADIISVSGIRLSNVATIYKLRFLRKQMSLKGLRWCGVPEWAALQLSGQWYTDRSLAVRTGCYDLRADTYSSRILEIAGLDRSLFPPIIPALQQQVRISPEAAARLHVREDVRIVVAGHDDLAATFACKAQPGTWVDSTGTAEALVCVLDRLPDPLKVVRAGMGLAPYYYPDTWAIVGGLGTTGHLMKTLQERVDLPYSEIDLLAARREAYPENAVRAELTPKILTDLQIMDGLTPAQEVNAFYDLLANAFHLRVESLAPFEKMPERFCIIGGSASADELCARKAALLPGVSCERHRGLEPTASGAAMIGLSGSCL